MVRYSQNLGGGRYVHYGDKDVAGIGGVLLWVILAVLFLPVVIIALIFVGGTAFVSNQAVRGFFMTTGFPVSVISIVLLTIAQVVATEIKRRNLALSTRSTLTVIGFRVTAAITLALVVFLSGLPLLSPRADMWPAWFTYFVPGLSLLILLIGLPLGFSMTVVYVVTWKRKRLAVLALVGFILFSILCISIVPSAPHWEPMLVAPLLGWYLTVALIGRKIRRGSLQVAIPGTVGYSLPA